MFRISEIILNCHTEIKSIPFYDVSYIYAGNNKGKTALIKIIDFMLGEGEFDYTSYEGLDNINSIEIELIGEGNDRHWFKRIKKNEFFYKKFLDQYISCSDDEYKEKINNLITKGFNEQAKTYFECFGENLTYRAFYFLSYLDEGGLGNLETVFPLAKEPKNLFRCKNLMSFLFNFESLIEINKKEKELLTVKEKLKKISMDKRLFDDYFYQIKKEFCEMSIPISSDLFSLKKEFDEYSKLFRRNKVNLTTTEKNDLLYLLKTSHYLSEQIKTYTSKNKQSIEIVSQNRKVEGLLLSFRDILGSDDKYASYLQQIEINLEKCKYENDVFLSQSFEKTIESIQAKKNSIDKDIKKISSSLKETEYDVLAKKILKLELYFEKIMNISNLEDFDELEELQSKLNVEINKLKKVVNETRKANFNKKLNVLYSELIDVNNFVRESLTEHHELKLEFNPLNISLMGKEKVYKFDGTPMELYFSPGSRCKQTIWQICCYLTLQDFFKTNFKSMPYIPFLIIDGLNQPFDENPDNFPDFFKFLKTKTREIGIQLIISGTISPSDLELDNVIDISEGLNPSHKK